MCKYATAVMAVLLAMTTLAEAIMTNMPVTSPETERKSDGQPNLLPNSSFEAGLMEWEVCGGEVQIETCTNAYHGTRVLRLAGRGSVGAPWINLREPKAVYELSVWARSVKGDASLVLELQNALNRGLQSKNLLKPWSVSETFALKETWQRFSLTLQLPVASYLDAFRSVIRAANGVVEVDAVALAVKEERPSYRPAEDVAVGLGTQEASNVLPQGVPVRLFAELYAPDPRYRPENVLLIVTDADGREIFRRQAKPEWDAASHARMEDELKELAPGFYPARVALLAGDGRTLVEKKFAFGVLVSHLDDPADPESPFGTMAGSSNELRLAKMTGVGFVRRVWFPKWSRMEPERGTYDWTGPDLDEIAKLGLVVQSQSASTPEWARLEKRFFSPMPDSAPPRDVADYGRFMGAAVRHYKAQVKLWEIWNEPNATFYWNGSVTEYVDLVRSAYAAVKAEDPEAQVWTCSTWNIDTNWLGQAMALGVLKHSDALAQHGYRKTPPESWEKDLQDLRELMKKHGGPVRPIVISEFGYQGVDAPDTNTPYLPEFGFKVKLDERQQAAWMVRTYVVTLAGGARALVWYKFSESRENNAGPDIHGLYRVLPLPQPKPGLVAYNTMATCLKGARGAKRVAAGDPTAHLYRFECPDGPRWVAWTTRDKPLSFTLPAGMEGPLEVRKLLGGTGQAAPVKGRTVLRLTGEPVFLRQPAP
ncbi:MAG: carbohydrate binding domain-containing protein [Lentisphaerae bacterium]|nr:carbohydrate binding domain-containing protein [Lentisphaerota bacterium]